MVGDYFLQVVKYGYLYKKWLFFVGSKFILHIPGMRHRPVESEWQSDHFLLSHGRRNVPVMVMEQDKKKVAQIVPHFEY
jgi:hypothetical protein